jgi:hypothetical protein
MTQTPDNGDYVTHRDLNTLRSEVQELSDYTHNEFGKIDHRLSDMDQRFNHIDVRLDEAMRLLRAIGRAVGTDTNGGPS